MTRFDVPSFFISSNDDTRLHTMSDAKKHALMFMETLCTRLEQEECEEVEHQDTHLSWHHHMGTYLLHFHAPTHQLWLSSPQSGASHYTYDPSQDTWVSTRNKGHTLTTLLNKELFS
jgi:frataxin